ncbi:hypothetical protein MBLNU459_g7765t1 [Dothideomycetes sp. NU459]
MRQYKVTRSHKQNDRDHVGLANGTAAAEEHLPRYFAKAGYADNDPKTVKKSGFGKGNWGKQMDELEDFSYNPTKPRRRSNSFSVAPGHDNLKSKFEHVEHEPVFEEEIHGASALDFENELEKQSTSSSMDSVTEEDK